MRLLSGVRVMRRLNGSFCIRFDLSHNSRLCLKATSPAGLMGLESSPRRGAVMSATGRTSCKRIHHKGTKTQRCTKKGASFDL